MARRRIEENQGFDTRLVFMHLPLFDPRCGLYHACIPESAATELAVLFRKYRVTRISTSYIHVRHIPSPHYEWLGRYGFIA